MREESYRYRIARIARRGFNRASSRETGFRTPRIIRKEFNYASNRGDTLAIM